MKYTYTYKFAYNKCNNHGEKNIPDEVTIEVNEYWYGIFTAFDKLEQNRKRADMRWHVSYEGLSS